MFGTLTSLVQSATVGPPPKDVPPPTEVVLPDYRPQSVDSDQSSIPPDSLVAFLQTLYRPPQLNDSYFEALGVHVHQDVAPEDIVPDPVLLPSAQGWDDMTPERAQDANRGFQRSLCNGNKSPDARIYADRRKEIAAENQAAFRTLRRIKPEPGKQAVRLGGSYEFFKQMDLMAAYWDDTSLPARERSEDDPSESTHDDESSQPPPKATQIPHPIDGSLDQAVHALVAATTEPARPRQHDGKDSTGGSGDGPEQVVYRTGIGSQMPGSYRHDMVAAFIKMVTYDFGCNISPARVEPRLYLKTPGQHGDPVGREPKCSHIPSGCTFLYRMPTTREAARAGILEGPVAAVSIRNATSFISSSPASSSVSSSTAAAAAKDGSSLDARLDFGRELVAALVTAQLRRREGKTEQRIGEGKWWANEKRWGGGQGGPIGREIENNDANGSGNSSRGRDGTRDKADSKQAPVSSPSPSASSPASSSSSSSSSSLSPPTLSARSPSPRVSSSGSGSGSSSSSSNKRARKTLSIYDNYRMVRKPASNWDKKTRYQAIGKQPGADHDDIFLFSSVFHHLSVVKVRVPHALLSVLEGDLSTLAAGADGTTTRPWGKLEVWRSRWFDLFIAEERLESMRLLWGVMMWLMRNVDDEGQQQGQGTQNAGTAASMRVSPATGGDDGDVVMKGS